MIINSFLRKKCVQKTLHVQRYNYDLSTIIFNNTSLKIINN